jgi:hypothetical protein
MKTGEQQADLANIPADKLHPPELSQPLSIYVVHDLRHPRPAVRSLFVPLERPKGLGKGFLDQVLGIVPITGHPPRDAIEVREPRQSLGLKIVPLILPTR